MSSTFDMTIQLWRSFSFERHGRVLYACITA